ncbi:chromosome assembly protein, partial [Reticulomyxa filosa]
MESVQKAVKKRVQMLNEAVSNLHNSLEELDGTQSSGKEKFMFYSLYSITYTHMVSVEQIKRELEETKKLVKERDNVIAKLKQSNEEKIQQLEIKEKALEEKEKSLDDEVNDIAKQ